MSVKATSQALDAASQMRNIIGNGLSDQITALNTQGTVLSDRNVFDGRLATEFQGIWSETSASLLAARDALAELNEHVNRILTGIVDAGGGF